jgi:hypothetical protein
MKRTRIKKRSKTPLAKAKLKLWKELKEVIKKRDGEVCISCGATGLTGHNKHGGHFIPSSSCGGFLRYDLRNVWIQCSTCNLFRNGAGAEYTIELQKRFGNKFVTKILKDKQRTIKLDIEYIQAMTEYYKSIQKLSKKKLIELTRNYKGFELNAKNNQKV